MICLTSVVLPAPFGPSRVSISPRSIENVISRLAQVPSAHRLLNALDCYGFLQSPAGFLQ